MARCPNCNRNLIEAPPGVFRCTNRNCYISRVRPGSLESLVRARNIYEEERERAITRRRPAGVGRVRWSGMTPEQRREAVERVREAGMTPEQKEERRLERIARRRHEMETARGEREEMRKRGFKAWHEWKGNISAGTVIMALVLIGAGFIVAAALGNIFFMFGFMSLGIYTTIPAPGKYTGPSMKEIAESAESPAGIQQLGNLRAFLFLRRERHTFFSFIRSLFKISAIVCFAYAFHDVGSFFNIAFIAIVFIGYFSLKIEYDPEIPGEFLESLLRFAILGCYFIPFYVFSYLFKSYVLVVMAFAFFAIVPISRSRSRGETGGEMAVAMTAATLDKAFFFVLMAIALVGSGALAPIGFQPEMFGAGWGLTGSMAYTFLYFWIISLIGGLFSPRQTRPVTGFIMMAGATVIWGLGPGSQEVGSALLGQWWPTVHSAFNMIAEPLGGVFGAISETFGNAFLMITNPVAYAHQVMDGTYGKTGGTEKVGSFGVEISGFSIGTGMNDIYVEQPFQLMFTIKNEGGFDAKNVRASIFTDLTYSTAKGYEEKEIGGEKVMVPTGEWQEKEGLEYKREKVYIEELVGEQTGENKPECTRQERRCSEYTFYVDGDKNNELGQQDIRSFLMGGVLGCEVVERADLREKFIPINVKVSYDYEVQSSFQVEFLSQAEWSRRAQAGTLVKRTEISEVTSAPVKLSLSSMEQPIRAGTGFFIGMKLNSEEGENSLIKPPVRVEVDIPREFVTLTQDSKVPCYGQATVTTDGKIIWEIKEGEGFKENVLYCDFYPSEDALVPGGNPSKTYYLNAKATYTFSKWEKKDAKLAFGSWCCSDKDCEKIGKVCVPSSLDPEKGTCQEEGAVPKPKECGELSFEECRRRADCQWSSEAVNPKTSEPGLCLEIE